LHVIKVRTKRDARIGRSQELAKLKQQESQANEFLQVVSVRLLAVLLPLVGRRCHD
jgi:hypothetical protein